MACTPEVLRQVPLFALLDDDETAVLASQVEVKTFAPRQRIWKIGDPSGQAYVMVSGMVRVTVVDEDHQEIVVDEPAQGEFFGFASMLDQTPHQSNAIAVEEAVCLEVDRARYLRFAGAQAACGHGYAGRAGPPVSRFAAAGAAAGFAQSKRCDRRTGNHWRTSGRHSGIASADRGLSSSPSAWLSPRIHVASVLDGQRSWDPYPFILLNLFLSMLAAIQAPIIMMSQNRQDKKDRLRSELDFDVNRRAESEIQGLAHKVNMIGDKIGDVEELLRKQFEGATS